jgi:prepilin peptidase CpaA
MTPILTPVQIALLAVFLATLASHDLATSRIPNALTIPFALLALLTHTFNDGFAGVQLSAAGSLLVLPILAPMYLTGGLGAGDVKALSAVGAMLGPLAVFWATAWTLLFGGLGGVLVLLTHGSAGRLGERPRRRLFAPYAHLHTAPSTAPPGNSTPLRFPYGLAIALGTAASVLWS